MSREPGPRSGAVEIPACILDRPYAWKGAGGDWKLTEHRSYCFEPV